MELINLLTNVNLSPDHRDTWRWNLSDDGIYTVKDLTSIVEDQLINGNNGQQTDWFLRRSTYSHGER